jgi:hypothetical protein
VFPGISSFLQRNGTGGKIGGYIAARSFRFNSFCAMAMRRDWQRVAPPAAVNHGGAAKNMSAKIYRPAKTAMQSGKAKTNLVGSGVRSGNAARHRPDHGLYRLGDTRQQLRADLRDSEQAVAYAERNGIEYRVIEPKDATRKSLSYSDNFRFSRTQPWTH